MAPVPTYYLMTIVGAGTNGMTMAVFGLYKITEAGLDPLQLVMVGTVFWVSRLILEVPTGVVADVYSRRLSVILGAFFVGAAVLIEGSLPIFGFILLAAVVGAFALSFVSGAREAWISDELGGQGVGRLFLRGTQIAYVSQMAGLGAGMALGSMFLALPFLVAGGIYIAMALLLVLVMPETGFRPVPSEERRSWRALARTFTAGIQTVRRRPMLWSVMAVALLYGVASEPVVRLWELHFLTNTTFPTIGNLKAVVWIGAINIGGSIVGLVILEGVRRCVDVDNPGPTTRVLFLINAVVIGGFVIFALAGNFALAAATYILAWGFWGVTDPVIAAWTNQNADSSTRATVFSFQSQTISVGMISGGPIMGSIARAWSIRAGLIGAVVVLAQVQVVIGAAMRMRSTRDQHTFR